MPSYKIEGTVSEPCKIYVIDSSDDSLVTVESVASAGSYSILPLVDVSNVHLLGVPDDPQKQALAYHSVDGIVHLTDYNAWFNLAAGGDDGMAEDWGGGSSNPSNTVNNFGSHSQLVWCRFTNVTIPSDAIITNAYVRLVYAGFQLGPAEGLNVKCIAEDNSPQRNWIKSQWDTLGKTSSVAASSGHSQSGGTNWDSPDIKTPIGEVIGRAGWNSGQALTVVFEDFAYTGNFQSYAAYEHATYNEPRLYVAWQA